MIGQQGFTSSTRKKNCILPVCTNNKIQPMNQSGKRNTIATIFQFIQHVSISILQIETALNSTACFIFPYNKHWPQNNQSAFRPHLK